ncbi:hypothetical protein [Pseudooceanicola sp.]|uniref:hypothetical protein n=1 Tax=Pseudooceanicola sp. TaxID=1914328 RepID=UPI004059FEDE
MTRSRPIRRETLPLQHLFLRLSEFEDCGPQWAIVAADIPGGDAAKPGEIVASGFLDTPDKLIAELRSAANAVEAFMRMPMRANQARRLAAEDASIGELCRPLSATVMPSRADWSEGKAQSDRGKLQAQRKNTGPKSRRSAAKGGSRP